MINWIFNNRIEIAGVIFTLIFLFLEVRGKWTMWIVGIVSAVFYVYINMGLKLYAMMGLSVYNAAICAYGLYCWRFMKTGKNEGLTFNYLSFRLGIVLCAVGFSVFGLIAFVLLKFTDIENPFAGGNGAFLRFLLDCLITTLSIIATWMAARKIIESWFLWMAVNPCTVALYVYSGMAPSAVLYIVYTVFSIFGYVQWKKMATAGW
jgi:nicotinamide mononucleotide transporter